MGAGDNNAVGIRLSVEAMLGQITDAIGGVTTAVNNLHQFLKPNPRQSPIVRPLAGTGISDGSTYFIVDLGGPTSGRVWDVRRVATWKGGGVDPFAAVTGVTVMLAKVPAGAVTGKGVALNQLTILDMAAAPLQVPNDVEYSAHEFSVKYLEHDALFYKGTTNLDQYVATGQAEEWLESTPEGVSA